MLSVLLGLPKWPARSSSLDPLQWPLAAWWLALRMPIPPTEPRSNRGDRHSNEQMAEVLAAFTGAEVPSVSVGAGGRRPCVTQPG